MREQIGIPLQLERCAEVQRGPATQRAQRRLEKNQEHEPDAQRREQFAIEGRQNLINSKLQEQWADDREQFEGRGKNEDLPQSALQSYDPANNVFHAEGTAFIAGDKAGG